MARFLQEVLVIKPGRLVETLYWHGNNLINYNLINYNIIFKYLNNFIRKANKNYKYSFTHMIDVDKHLGY
ncbi:Uncharacterised protein [uncultured archaeon]|nr:Uncharacterised protein [uncultured archaeon]